MKINLKKTLRIAFCAARVQGLPASVAAQDYSAADSVQNHEKGNRLSIGGY